MLRTILRRAGPWIAVFSCLTVIGCWPLWYAAPAGGASVLYILTFLVIAQIGVEFATVFTNAMLPGIAAAGRLGRGRRQRNPASLVDRVTIDAGAD